MMKLNAPYLGCLIFIMIAIIKLGEASRLMSQSANNDTIKTIKSKDGDVIDCVLMSRQPAFDHPLLKGHTIKMKPSNHPDTFATKPWHQITQVWQMSGNCPEGTIPIRRTDKRKGSITKKYSRHFNVSNSSSLIDPNAGQVAHEYAVATTRQGNYYGTQAIISSWNPYVESRSEFSLSQLWIVGGSGSDLNTIEVGWNVYPQLYGDSNTRLFLYWTSDSYQSTGCYNLGCGGFVQITNRIAIGGSMATTTDRLQELSLLVWLDKGQSVWWLQCNGVIVGYWPTSIFTGLKGSASVVEWGGEIINSHPGGGHTGTQMGSGSFAEAWFRKASYFRKLLVVNDANYLISPPTGIASFSSYSKCYDIITGNSNSADWGNYFFYGGPGRNSNCP